MPVLVEVGSQATAFLIFYSSDKICGTVSINSELGNILFVKDSSGNFVESLPDRLTKSDVFKFSFKSGVDYFFRFDDLNTGFVFADETFLAPISLSSLSGVNFEVQNFERFSSVITQDYGQDFKLIDSNFSIIHNDLMVLNFSLIFIFLFYFIRGLFRWR